jgi:hypothetical protein
MDGFIPIGGGKSAFPIQIGADAHPSLAAAFTNPRWICASVSTAMQVGQGASATNKTICSRKKMKLAGGDWLALAIVYIGAYNGVRNRLGQNDIARTRLAAVAERANGASNGSFNSSNAGATQVPVTFSSGLTEGIIEGGFITVSDVLLPSQFGVSTFRVDNRGLDFWVRTAMDKPLANTVLPEQFGSFNHPLNEHHANVADWATALALIAEVGVQNYNGANKFGSSDSNQLPCQMMIIGIPGSGQKAILGTGTSIFHGQNSPSFNPSGTDPITPANMNFTEFLPMFAEDLTVSAPVLSIPQGGSSIVDTWGDAPNIPGRAGDSQTPNTQAAIIARSLQLQLSKYFDYVIGHDVQNDTDNATWRTAVNRFIDQTKAANPSIKILWCRPPSDGVTITGTSTGDGTSQDGKWNYLQTLVGSKIDAIFDLREPGQPRWAVLPDRLTGAATGGTTTTVVTGVPMLHNIMAGAWIQFTSGPNNGLMKWCPTNNSAGVLTLDSALPNAVQAGDTFRVLGNTAGWGGTDFVHGITFGYLRMAQNFRSRLSAFDPTFPFFTRTA